MKLSQEQVAILKIAALDSPPPESMQLVPIWIANVLRLKSVSYADCLKLADSWRSACSS